MKYGAYQIPVSNWDGKQYSDAATNASAARLLGLQNLQTAYKDNFHNLSDNYATYVKNERDAKDASAYGNFISLVNKNNQEIQYNQDLLNNPNTSYEQREGIANRLRQLQENDRVLREGFLSNISVENAGTYTDKLLNEPAPARKVALELSAQSQAKSQHALEAYQRLIDKNPALSNISRRLLDKEVDIRSSAENSKERQENVKSFMHTFEDYIKLVNEQSKAANIEPSIIQEIIKNLRNEFSAKQVRFYGDSALLSTAEKQRRPLVDNLPPSSK